MKLRWLLRAFVASDIEIQHPYQDGMDVEPFAVGAEGFES